MAQIPRAALDYLTEQVRGLVADASGKVSRLLESIEWRQGDIAECRAALVDALLLAMPAYTDAAAQAGADFYDAVRACEAGEAMGALAFSGFDPEAFEGAVRAFVQDVVDGKPAEQLNGKVIDRVDRDIRRSANISVAENARRDPLKPKYARVPSGGETCEFCIMLASRGAVYGTVEAASHAHPGCDCRVVPSFDGGYDIEGYDPDGLYERWKALVDRGRSSIGKGEKVGDNGFRRIVVEHSMEDDLEATNPRFREGLQWRINCQRCVPAYEMRRRGFDVVAKPRELDASGLGPSNDDQIAKSWTTIFKDAEWIRCQGTGRRTIDRLMREWGDGARAEVYVAWRGDGAHVFVAENVDGRVQYVCPQSSRVDYSRAFEKVVAGRTMVARIDHLEPSDMIGGCCDSRRR